ncbi:hypothetical protein G9A89_020614 [Geosiphon pyriformis]|nr:hypothetical protein G9A89_020614 [Geosiphon pyriformis]
MISGVGFLNIFGLSSFVSVCDCLSWVGTGSLFVYMDRFLKGLDTVGCKAGAVVFFKDIDLSLGIDVSGLMSSTLAKMQAIVLALKCVLLSSSVHLFLDSQFTLDAYKSELDLVCPDFHN